MSYACEVWGFCKAEQLDRMYLGFLKSILCVRKTVPTAFVYNELGLFPLIIIRQLRILKYWFKILNMHDKNPIKIIYKLLVSDLEVNVGTQNWVSLLKDMLDQNGFGHVWIGQGVPNEKSFIHIFEKRIKDIFMQNNNTSIYGVSENRLFPYLQHAHETAHYLVFIKEKYIRVALTKFRLGSHNFMIERGRWEKPKTEFLQRVCDTCNKVEDEFHIVFNCSKFNNLRKQHINLSFVQNPSMYKLIELINSEDEIIVRKLGIFLHKVFKIYDGSI